jgi:hypothetical protein
MSLSSAPVHAAHGVQAPAVPAVPTLTTTLFGAHRGLKFVSGSASLALGTSLTINLDFKAANAQLQLIAVNAVIGDQLMAIWVINPGVAPVKIGTIAVIGGRGTTVISPLPVGVPLAAGTTISVTGRLACLNPLFNPLLMSFGLGTF